MPLPNRQFIKEAFEQFARNERWGTCGECPRNADNIYPEFCINTKRYDHQLTLDQLYEQYKIRKEKS